MSKNVFKKLSEIKEIVNCFLAMEEDSNVILVNKINEEEVIFVAEPYEYDWNGNILTIAGREIRISSLKELDFGDRLDIGKYVLQVL